MKKLKKLIPLLLALLIFSACDKCEKTYRTEIGVGYVFMYDTINNTSSPVEGAKIFVRSEYVTFGL